MGFVHTYSEDALMLPSSKQRFRVRVLESTCWRIVLPNKKTKKRFHVYLQNGTSYVFFGGITIHRSILNALSPGVAKPIGLCMFPVNVTLEPLCRVTCYCAALEEPLCFPVSALLLLSTVPLDKSLISLNLHFLPSKLGLIMASTPQSLKSS